jgi:hypothetical protein
MVAYVAVAAGGEAVWLRMGHGVAVVVEEAVVYGPAQRNLSELTHVGIDKAWSRLRH